ncbi:MAG: hypothetical protein V9G98_22605 [Candidatus Competibacter sp.]
MTTPTIQSLQAEVSRLGRLVDLLINGETIHRVGGYAYGRTKKGDAFIILYPAADRLKLKVCRVYQEEFPQLPSFIDTNVPTTAQRGNPDRPEAQDMGIYRPCPHFLMLTREGKDTQMGPEVRFSRVLDAPPVPAPASPVAPSPRPPVAASPSASPTGDDLIECRYQNGTLAEADEERRAFNAWRRAHQGKSPLSRTGLRTWWATHKPQATSQPAPRTRSQAMPA